jgi:hypothetical protein
MIIRNLRAYCEVQSGFVITSVQGDNCDSEKLVFCITKFKFLNLSSKLPQFSDQAEVTHGITFLPGAKQYLHEQQNQSYEKPISAKPV